MKGVFIPEITVEMLRNASLDTIEDFFSRILSNDNEVTIFNAELPQWIPCECITEPIDREVLCCDKYDNELIGWLDYNDYEECWVCESDECIMYDTVAYMEKPKPYEGRTE